VRVLPQERAGANDDIDTVDTSLNSDFDIVHVTSDVSQDLGLEAELADSNAVQARLLTRARAGKLNAVNSELVKGFGDSDLGLGVEVGVGELLALSQCRLNDFEI